MSESIVITNAALDEIGKEIVIRGVVAPASLKHMVLARVFANHHDFWTDASFKINVDLKRKLSLFPITDPHINSLCSSQGPAHDILYQLMVQHLNSGRRTRRLKPFVEMDDPEEPEETETEDEETEEEETIKVVA